MMGINVKKLANTYVEGLISLTEKIDMGEVGKCIVDSYIYNEVMTQHYKQDWQ